ncbi:unnamed protein product [Phaeothamnion confervicola]
MFSPQLWFAVLAAIFASGAAFAPSRGALFHDSVRGLREDCWRGINSVVSPVQQSSNTAATDASASGGGGGGSIFDETLEPAPATFAQCILQAQDATRKALSDGYRLMEVEFPPLPTDYLEDAQSSAYDISRTNVRLAIDFSKVFALEGKSVSVLLPDDPELERAIEDEGSDEPFPRVKLCSLRRSTSSRAMSLDQLFLGVLGRNAGDVEAVEGTDVYVAIIFSCQEMPDLEALHKLDPDKPIVFFNLKLDTQRGDLGLPAFPSKDLHYRFMSRIKPVYLLRTRAYSRSLSRPPFLVNYQGAQYRVYPGGYQALLDVGNRYKRVAVSTERPSLGEFKETLTASLQLGNDDKESKVASFFRKGYKTRTWWEEPNEKEIHQDWRS